MTYEEAKRILHPDTTRDAIREIVLDDVDAVKAVEQACLVACEAIDKVLASQWVPVSERLPEANRFLYISRFNRNISIGQKRYGDNEWIVGGLLIKKDVLWWMPLPEPPKEGTT